MLPRNHGENSPGVGNSGTSAQLCCFCGAGFAAVAGAFAAASVHLREPFGAVSVLLRKLSVAALEQLCAALVQGHFGAALVQLRLLAVAFWCSFGAALLQLRWLSGAALVQLRVPFGAALVQPRWPFGAALVPLRGTKKHLGAAPVK